MARDPPLLFHNKNAAHSRIQSEHGKKKSGKKREKKGAKKKRKKGHEKKPVCGTGGNPKPYIRKPPVLFWGDLLRGGHQSQSRSGHSPLEPTPPPPASSMSRPTVVLASEPTNHPPRSHIHIPDRTQAVFVHKTVGDSKYWKATEQGCDGRCSVMPIKHPSNMNNKEDTNKLWRPVPPYRCKNARKVTSIHSKDENPDYLPFCSVLWIEPTGFGMGGGSVPRTYPDGPDQSQNTPRPLPFGHSSARFRTKLNRLTHA